MRLSRTLIISTAVAACAAAAATLGLGTAASAAGSGQQIPVAYRPISADAPFDTLVQSATCAPWPKLVPRRGTDYGHLPRWARGAGGAVVLRVDRVDLHSVSAEHCYTNVNPRIRSYLLDRNAVVTVRYSNYTRMAHQEGRGAGPFRVSRQQFLDSFNTRPDSWERYLKYTSVYRLTFDRTGTRILRVDEVEADWHYGRCGC
jgi:hypothetical protein